MASVREQILQAVFAKLEEVRDDLNWQRAVRNPRDALPEGDLNAVVQMDGGLRDPRGLTGHVEENGLEFSVGLLVKESSAETAEALLDAGYVAVKDKLLDPDDIQLGGIASGIEALGGSDPIFGRPQGGARILGGMTLDFMVRFYEREGDASTPAP